MGDVIAPHSQNIELGVNKYPIQTVENRKFSDFTNAYIPQIETQMHGVRSSWLALWSTKNELGHPLLHISGFSPIYFPTWALFKLIDDPYEFITLYSLLLAYISGMFAFLFSREKQYAPASCLISAFLIAFSPTIVYWLTFPMFISSLCWGICILWASLRFYNRADYISLVFVTFGVYSIIMVGYPQMTVLVMYVVTIYLFCETLKRRKNIEIKQIAILFLFAVLGVAVSSLFLANLYEIFLNSSRVLTPYSFFSKVLPKINDLGGGLEFLCLTFFPELMGNTISQDFPKSYNGISFNLITLFLLCSSVFFIKRHQVLVWLSLILAIVILTFNHSFNFFAYSHLGFNISRTNPLFILVIPVTFLITEIYNCLITSNSRCPYLIISMLISSAAYFVSFHYYAESSYGYVFFIVSCLFFFCLSFNKSRHLSYLPFCLLIVLVAYPKLFHIKRSEIVTTSPIVEFLKNTNSQLSNFIIVSNKKIHILPPNINAVLGLNSIHSYNSLSSNEYHRLISGLRGNMFTFGRLNATLNPNFGDDVFWMANISSVISIKAIVDKNLELITKIDNYYLYKVKSTMGFVKQFSMSPLEEVKSTSLLKESYYDIDYNVNYQGDKIAINTKSVNMNSLLLLSQLYNVNWDAHAFVHGNFLKLKPFSYNGIFLGLRLPPGTSSVVFKYNSPLYYMIYINYFWLFIFGFLLLILCKKRVWLGALPYMYVK